VVLQTVSRERLKRVMANPAVRKEVDNLAEERRRVEREQLWFHSTYPRSGLTCAAYFSMEFMLSEALPIYSGGLGNVAGDFLKAASDLGVPVVGVGLLYQQGYFRQLIDQNGMQQALYPYNDPGQLPITPLRMSNGEWLRIEVRLPGFSAWLRTWHVEVGGVSLYLLDSNDAANFPPHRGITSELYGGGTETRLKQELILGIGGWRLLRAIGKRPQVCHLNEGHAAFAVLERARDFMAETGASLKAALAATRAGNLFTTHTAVEAGFDRFPPEMIEKYLSGYAERLGITAHELLALGRRNANDSSEPFSMAYLAVRGSGQINAVSRLHGQVSRRLFAPLFPRWPEHEVPIQHVTNGVHMRTWDSAAADDLWTQASGKDRWLWDIKTLESDMRRVGDERLWRLRTDARRELVEYVRERLSRQLAASGASAEEVAGARERFDPRALTLGFARRFATYKRPNLLLSNPERFLRLLNDRERPMQLIVAGKAHPADGPGQALIQEWVRFAGRPEARAHVAFLSDYDVLLTESLVQGVDVWINTPRRPWEACGTSGMKVLVNGGINISELDGWWAEAYTPEIGWAIGDGREHGDDPAWDAAEAEMLYTLLEKEVVPEFYTRGRNGIPAAWAARMRESMARLTGRFSANRMVREYTEQHYIPAVKGYLLRAEDKGATGRKVAQWGEILDEKWTGVRFGEMKVSTEGRDHSFDVQIDLNGLEAAMVRVELYAEGTDGGVPTRQEMTRMQAKKSSNGWIEYRARVSATRPAADFTARIIAACPDAAIPLECPQILWQR